jgi:hypothetical protein
MRDRIVHPLIVAREAIALVIGRREAAIPVAPASYGTTERRPDMLVVAALSMFCAATPAPAGPRTVSEGKNMTSPLIRARARSAIINMTGTGPAAPSGRVLASGVGGDR